MPRTLSVTGFGDGSPAVAGDVGPIELLRINLYYPGPKGDEGEH